MRNIIMLLISVFTLSTAVAQDVATTSTEPSVIKSKRGFNVLPEAGEWGLGVSANPFLRYLGNVLNGNTFNAQPTFDYSANPANNPANNIALFGKYVVDANTQYRVRFNVNIGTTINKGILLQDELNPDPLYPNYTEDWQRVNNQTIVVAAGYEKRRGSTRLQGVYGGELVIGYNASKQTYDYGNSMNVDFQTPQTFNYFVNITQPGALGTAIERITEIKTAPSLLLGARGFIGVEYFFAPKMSLGGEFGYMLAFRNTGKTEFTTERWNPDTNSVLETVNNSNGALGLTSVGIGLDNLSGSINLLFYF